MSLMSIIVGLLCAGLIIALAQIQALQRELEGRLHKLPLDVWLTVKKEREREGDAAFNPERIATLVTAIREYHDKLVSRMRTEHGDAEMRAALVQRESADTATALDAAMVLVREARLLVDRLAPDPAQVAAGLGPKPATTTSAISKSTRPHRPPQKVEPRWALPPPPIAPPVMEEPSDGDRTTEEELTVVADRSATNATERAKTLASMPAVDDPTTKRGAS